MSLNDLWPDVWDAITPVIISLLGLIGACFFTAAIMIHRFMRSRAEHQKLMLDMVRENQAELRRLQDSLSDEERLKTVPHGYHESPLFLGEPQHPPRLQPHHKLALFATITFFVLLFVISELVSPVDIENGLKIIMLLTCLYIVWRALSEGIRIFRGENYSDAPVYDPYEKQKNGKQKRKEVFSNGETFEYVGRIGDDGELVYDGPYEIKEKPDASYGTVNRFSGDQLIDSMGSIVRPKPPAPPQNPGHTSAWR